jgi:hypothetical protein
MAHVLLRCAKFGAVAFVISGKRLCILHREYRKDTAKHAFFCVVVICGLWGFRNNLTGCF